MVLNCIILRWTKKQQHRENCVNHTIPSMFHSEILALLNFNKIKILSPGLENNHTLKRLFWQFSNITKYVKSVGKIPDQHLSVWLFSNNLDIYDHVGKLPEQCSTVWLFPYPGDKSLFLLKFNEAWILELNLWFTKGYPGKISSVSRGTRYC